MRYKSPKDKFHMFPLHSNVGLSSKKARKRHYKELSHSSFGKPRSSDYQENSTENSVAKPTRQSRQAKIRKVDYYNSTTSSEDESSDVSLFELNEDDSESDSSEDLDEDESANSENLDEGESTDDEIRTQTRRNTNSKRKKETLKAPDLPSLEDDDNFVKVSNGNQNLNQYIAKSTQGGKYYYKENYCKLCGTLENRIDRHYLRQHKDLPEVKAILQMKPRSAVRRAALGNLRRAGNNFFNNNPNINPNKIIISERRLRVNSQKLNENQKDNVSNEQNIVRVEQTITDENENVAKEQDFHMIEHTITDNEKDGVSMEQDIQQIEHDTSNSEKDNLSTEQNITPIDEQTTNEPSMSSLVNENQVTKVINARKSKQVQLARIECPHCLGFFTATNIHNHVRNVHPEMKTKPDSRHVKKKSIESMKLFHPDANALVLKIIAPKLKLDEIGVAARYDRLITLFANKYIKRYIKPDKQSYLRNYIRLFGSLKINIQKIDSNLTELEMTFKSAHIETYFEAMYITGGYDVETNKFDKIYNAETLPIITRKLFKIF